MLRIDRCVCHSTSFADLRRLASERGVTSFEGLEGLSPCGRGCGMCRPYIRAMLATGEVVFTRLLTDDSPR